MTNEDAKAAAAEIEFWQRLALCFMNRMNVTEITLEAEDIRELQGKFNGELPALGVTINTVEQNQFIKLNLYNPKEAEVFAAELKKETWRPSEG